MSWSFYDANGKLLQGVLAGSVDTTELVDDAVTAAKLASDAVVNLSVASGAAIAYAKLAALADGNILVGNGSNVAVSVSPSGDIDVSNAGVLSLNSTAISGFSAKTSIADADTILLGDSAASGALKKMTKVNFVAGLGGAISLQGSNTTEATTTSTGAVDLLSVASLSMVASTQIWAAASVRQTENSGRVVGFGMKLNTTVISEAESSYNQSDLLWVGEQSVANSGAFLMHMGSRVANYLDGKTRMSSRAKSSVILDLGMSLRAENNMPTATITDVVTRAVCTATTITGCADEMHVYTLAVS